MQPERGLWAWLWEQVGLGLNIESHFLYILRCPPVGPPLCAWLESVQWGIRKRPPASSHCRTDSRDRGCLHGCTVLAIVLCFPVKSHAAQSQLSCFGCFPSPPRHCTLGTDAERNCRPPTHAHRGVCACSDRLRKARSDHCRPFTHPAAESQVPGLEGFHSRSQYQQRK